MARRPGSRSNASLLSSGAWVTLGLTILICGHVALVYLLVTSLFGSSGMNVVTNDTTVPHWMLGLLAAGAVIIDSWIVISLRRAQRKAMQR